MMAKTHTTLDLDRDLLRDAAEALGTTRTTETVHAALRDVVARRRRAWLARRDFSELEAALPSLRTARVEAVEGELGGRRWDLSPVRLTSPTRRSGRAAASPGWRPSRRRSRTAGSPICDQVAMELLWSARDLADFRATEAGPSRLPVVLNRAARLDRGATGVR